MHDQAKSGWCVTRLQQSELLVMGEAGDLGKKGKERTHKLCYACLKISVAGFVWHVDAICMH